MTPHRLIHVKRIAVAGVALILAACAATTLKNSWRDPNYNGPPLKKIMVVGVSNQADTRRTFEDEFVKQLKASGVQGIQSYTLIPQNGKAEEGLVKQAAQQSGADGVLITRFVRVDVNAPVAPAYAFAPGMSGGFAGGYAGAWGGGYYDAPMAYQTDTLVLETAVYGLNDTVLLWSGSTETFEPTSVQKDAPGLAKVIINALKNQKLI
jgi:hypothetical protein